MCNRFRGLSQLGDLSGHFPIDLGINFPFNPNVAPTDSVPVFFAVSRSLPRLAMGRFGILLKGTKPHQMLNTRTDTLRRGVFKKQLNEKRCVIPAQGFYEWREEHGLKQPYYFYRKDNQPILFAGIWDFSDVAGDQMTSFSILTDETNDLMAPYHDRMPVILDNPAPWMEYSVLDDILPISPDQLTVRPVNRAVNKASMKDLALIEDTAPPMQQSLF